VLRQQRERQLPDDAALQIGEVVKLVHDHGRDVGEVERFLAERHIVGQIRFAVRVQQSIEQNLGDNDEDAGIGINAAIAGDESDIVGFEPPAHGGCLHLLEFLLG
jgi:hypothetical protein